MRLAPREEFLVLAEHGVNQLIEHILGRLAEERGIREQRLVALPIQPRNVADQVLPARAGLDHRHTLSSSAAIADRLPRALTVDSGDDNAAQHDCNPSWNGGVITCGLFGHSAGAAVA